MRIWVKFFSIAGLAMALANAGQAGVGHSGGFSFALSTLPAITVSGPGGLGGSTGGAGSTITIGPVSWTATVTGVNKITLAPTAAVPLTAISAVIKAPANCTFSLGGGGGGGLGGACGLGGTINALVLSAPFLFVPVSGVGGSARLGFGVYGSYIDPKIWTTGVTSVTINGVALTTGNATFPGAVINMSGYDNRTVAGYGAVRLVAPAGFMSTLRGDFPLFVSMNLVFIPEPGTLLLVGFGVISLGLLGRGKQKNA